MTDRLRQMSLRQFRIQIVDLRAPVEVSRRDNDGNIQVLGFWTPYMQEAPGALAIPVDDEGDGGFPMGEDSEFDRHPRTAPRLISSPEEVAKTVRINPVRAVPKPSQRRRKP
jgi:hypothetical protein